MESVHRGRSSGMAPFFCLKVSVAGAMLLQLESPGKASPSALSYLYQSACV